MFSRIRSALGLACALALMTSLMVFAKGGFSFIIVAGANLEATVRITDTRLTQEFFAFADFYRDKVDAPNNPGQGYEVTRYYVDGKREIAFDQLHYYPETGYVFYDGILNGESEYDGEWYSANPAVKTVFESVLPVAPIAKAPPVKQPESVKPIAPVAQVQPMPSIDPSQVVVPVAIISVVMVLALFALRFTSRPFNKGG